MAAENKHMNGGWGNIPRLYQKLKGQSVDYYELFDVRPDATKDQIRENYFNFARRYHPDKIAGLGNPQLIEMANYVFSEFNNGFEALTDDEKRRDYDEKRKNSSFSSNGSAQLPEKARKLFNKARFLYGEKDFKKALAMMNSAIYFNDTIPAYFLLLAKCQVTFASQRREAENNLLKVIDKEPWNHEAYFAMADLFFREGFMQRATNFLHKTLSIEPTYAPARQKLLEIRPKKSWKGFSNFRLRKNA